MRPLPALALALVVSAYATMVLGSYVTSTSSGLGCGPDWPTCQGRVFPDLSNTPMVIEWFHRLSALIDVVVGLPILALVFAEHRRNLHLVIATSAAAGLLVVQVLLGMITVRTDLHPLYVTAHQGTAAAFFGSTIALAFISWRTGRGQTASDPSARGVARRGLRQVLRDYLHMLKPGILALLVLTCMTSAVVAMGTRPPFAVIVLTPVGGALAAGSAAALNNFLDRGVDSRMMRTLRRPLPAGRVEPENALAFALLLGVSALLLLWFFVNPLSAALALGGLLFYVIVYTAWLKRDNPQNIVIGGAAGCFPALVGWAAVTNGLGIPALLLAAIVFLWTPPHFWALALVYKDDYARADIPMMPVVAGDGATKRQMLMYSISMVAVSFLLFPLGALGLAYIVVAVVLGAIFLLFMANVLRRPGPGPCLRLFGFSIVYLMALLGAMVADRLVVLL